ncbi:efflux transporter outer membrane subunit [Massilia sp. METH4]|uniref:efflux transporter outer membrane subunit n=1 Tax=Massilia sp. METH4 TaxID=3123041 RepID=UPI0030CEFB77
MNSAADYPASQSFAGLAGAWPTDQWWKEYGDPQLDSLIEEALRASPSLASAQARFDRAAAQVQSARGSLAPSVDASVAAGKVKQSYNNGVPEAFVPHGWNTSASAALNLSWELDFWGKNRAAVAAVTSEADAADADRAQARLVLTTAIASGYAELVRLHAARATAQQALALRRQTAVLFSERQRSGLETVGSLRQVEARQALAEADLLAIDESISLQAHQLAYLAGAGPDRALGITAPVLDLPAAIRIPSSLPAELIGRRPDIAAARARAQAMAQRIDEARAAFYPNINLSAAIGFQSLGLDMLTKSGSLAGNAGPAVSLPVFNTSRLQGQYKGARADYDEAVASYNDTLAQALREVADAATSQRMLSGRLDRTEAAVVASEDAWHIMRNRYRGGLATYLEVLNAEDALLGNTRDLTALRTRMFALNVQMIRALGGGVTVTNGKE